MFNQSLARRRQSSSPTDRISKILKAVRSVLVKTGPKPRDIAFLSDHLKRDIGFSP